MVDLHTLIIICGLPGVITFPSADPYIYPPKSVLAAEVCLIIV